MKKFFVFGLIGFMSLCASAQGVFNKGERKIDLTIGVGSIAYDKVVDANAMFDQHFSMEWGIASIADKVTVGLGFAVNNSYGGKIESLVVGKYDYKYAFRNYGKIYDFSANRWKSYNETRNVTRKGVGTADADIKREDVNVLATVSFHYSPIERLDTYMKLGVGVGYMTYLISNYRNIKGFEKANVKNYHESKYNSYTDEYSYDDLEHAEWDGLESKIVPALATYIGATYYLTEKWGVEAQLGLISANIKDKNKGYPNSYGVFAVGATYKF